MFNKYFTSYRHLGYRLFINLSSQKGKNFTQMMNSERPKPMQSRISNLSFFSQGNQSLEEQSIKNMKRRRSHNDEVVSQKSSKSNKSIKIIKGGLEVFHNIVNSMLPLTLVVEQKICGICEELQAKKKPRQFGLCKHVFCQDCLKSYAKHKIDNFQLILCPFEGCEAKLDHQDELYRQLMTEDQKVRYKKIQRQLQVLSDPNLRLCENQHCEGVLNLKTWKQRVFSNPQSPIICQKCQLEYCRQCFEAKHQGSCQKNVIKFLQRNKKFRQCKKCKRVIQKSQGCTHMTCLCGHYFCYMCGQELQNIGIHQCTVPKYLNCMQTIRWEIQHKEMFYESNLLSFHRCLYCFQLSNSVPTPLRYLYSIAYTFIVYPISILLFLTLVVFFFALFALILVLLFAFLPLSQICTQRDYTINLYLQDKIGSCGLTLCIILFYPLFVIAILFEAIYHVCNNEDVSEQAKIVFSQIGYGFRNVLLMPCVLCVSPQSLEIAQQSLNKQIQNGV